jgi:hypothetical protein
LRIRQHISNVSVLLNTIQSEEKISDMVAYYTRQRDNEILKEALDEAFGMGIVDIKTESGSVETYKRGGAGSFREKLDTGEIDAINVGWGHKVVNAKATMFTEPGLKFSLVQTEEGRDLSQVEAVIARHRKTGGFQAENVAADKLSVFLGSCGMLVSYHRKSLRYKKFTPDMVRVFFGTTVYEDGVERPVNRSDIEDASAVILRMGQIDTNKYSYLGIVPANTEFPHGRYVTFIDGLQCFEIPGVNDEKTEALDYQLLPGEDGTPGVICNPLSWFASQHPDLDVPEIPISIILGGTTDADCLFPTSDSMFVTALAFDKKSSHIMDNAETKAIGTTAIKDSELAQGKPLPRTVNGVVHLEFGREIEDVSSDASAAQTADSILRTKMIDAASGYSVPDFFVVSENYTLDASSGIALEVKSRPLQEDRRNRSELTENYVRRLFAIERAYIGFKAEEAEADITTLLECSQEWEAGVLKLPENKKEKTDRINARLAAGTMDVIAAIREENDLASDADAIALYEKMSERMKDYPALNFAEKQEAQKQKVGLLRGMQRGQDVKQ